MSLPEQLWVDRIKIILKLITKVQIAKKEK